MANDRKPDMKRSGDSCVPSLSVQMRGIGEPRLSQGAYGPGISPMEQRMRAVVEAYLAAHPEERGGEPVGDGPNLWVGGGRGTPSSLPEYLWAEDWGGEGFSVALVSESSPEEVLGSLRVRTATDLASPAEVRQWASEAKGGRRGWVEAGTLDAWTLVQDCGGYDAVDAIGLSHITGDAQVAVVSRSINADTVFEWMTGGSVVRRFDPVLYGSDAEVGMAFGTPLAEERGLAFEISPIASSFLLLERLTGVHLTAYRIANPMGSVAVGYEW